MVVRAFIVPNVKNNSIMKNKLLIVVFISLFCACSPKIDYIENAEVIGKEKEVDGYVFGTADIPLLAGLEIVEEESTNFDTFAGNISVAVYFGSVDLQEARDFSSRILPQIGFKIDSSDDNKIKLSRENDNLEINFEQKGEQLSIKFQTSSK